MCIRDSSNSLLSWFRLFSVKNIDPTSRTGTYLIEAISELRKEMPNLSELLSVQIWGDIYPGNAKLIQDLGLDDIIEISGYCSHEETQAKLQSADVLFLPLESELDGQAPLHIPGKLYEYLKMDKPILTLCGESDCKEIVRKAGVGEFAEPKNIPQIKAALKKLLSNQSKLKEVYQADQEWIESKFSAASLTNQLVKVIQELQT